MQSIPNFSLFSSNQVFLSLSHGAVPSVRILPLEAEWVFLTGDVALATVGRGRGHFVAETATGSVPRYIASAIAHYKSSGLHQRSLRGRHRE